MATRNPQTAAKRAREQAKRERNERKRAKKALVAAERAAAKDAPPHELADADAATPSAPAGQSASL